MEIVPQVHLVPGTHGANVYLIEEATLTLVDTGLRRNAEAIIRYVGGLGRRPEDLTSIVLTHHHLDHAGSAAELQARTGARLLVHAADADAVQSFQRKESRPRYEGARGLFGQLVERHGKQDETLAVTPIRDGRVLPALGGLVVIHTPDHTPGSICLYSQKRRLTFVGDLVLNNASRLSRPLPSYGSRLRRAAVYEASLWRLASLDFDLCLFGHGPPVLAGGSQLIREVAERGPSRFLAGRIARNLGTLIAFARRLSKRTWRRRGVSG